MAKLARIMPAGEQPCFAAGHRSKNDRREGKRQMHADAAPPASERYFEDYVPGSVHESGSVVVGEAEIVEFARRYDPQFTSIPIGRPRTARSGA